MPDQTARHAKYAILITTQMQLAARVALPVQSIQRPQIKRLSASTCVIVINITNVLEVGSLRYVTVNVALVLRHRTTNLAASGVEFLITNPITETTTVQNVPVFHILWSKIKLL
jgi:hypothetical protein